MKKKILAILTAFSVLFIFGGIYIIISVEKATSKLDDLIKLHQVEIIREHLLLEIRKVQSELGLKNTRYAGSEDDLAADVKRMRKISLVCRKCHHAAGIDKRLENMQGRVNEYGNAVEKIFSAKEHHRSRPSGEDSAYEMGEDLVETVNGMIALTSSRLDNKTKLGLRQIDRAKAVTYVLLVAGPLMAIGLAFFFERILTKPASVLIEAIRRIKEGALDYKIEGLKDEFGEVAASFNEMAGVLKGQLNRIQESEKRYRTLFESAVDAILILEAEGAKTGKIIAANKAAAIIYGYSIEELLDMEIKDLGAHGSSRKMEKDIRSMLENEWIKAEVMRCKKDGTVIPVEVSAGLLELSGHKYVLTFDRDVTERKQAERLLQRTEQLKMCGEFAAGLAHEIKNPLAGIKASMELIFKDVNIDEEDRTILLKTIEDIIRIESFMKELLGFAKPPEPQFMMTDVNEIVNSTVLFSVRHPSFSNNGNSITISKDLDACLPPTMADPLKLRQVFMNLMLNAADAMPAGGTLAVNTSYDSSGNIICILFSDTGKGIKEQIAGRIFEPFFTTKPKGTGIGLATVKRLIEQHDGTIEVKNGSGTGATFVLTLPVRQMEAQ